MGFELLEKNFMFNVTVTFDLLIPYQLGSSLGHGQKKLLIMGP